MSTNNRPKVTRVNNYDNRLWITFDNELTDVAHPLDTFFVTGVGRTQAIMLRVGQEVAGTAGDLTITTIEEMEGE